LTAGFLLTLILLYFLLARGDRALEKIIALTPKFSNKKKFVEGAREVEARVSSYLLTVIVVNSFLGLFVGLTLWWLNMPTPALWGIAAAVLNFIPILGAIAGVLLVGGVALVTFDTTGAAISPPLVYLGLTILEGNFVTPAILGRTLSMSPVAVFLSLLFWGWLWGALGVAVAVPLLIVFTIACKQISELEPVAVLLER